MTPLLIKDFGPHWRSRTGQVSESEEEEIKADERRIISGVSITPSPWTVFISRTTPILSTLSTPTKLITTSPPRSLIYLIYRRGFRLVSGKTTIIQGASIPLDQVSIDEEGHRYNDQICWGNFTNKIIIKII